MVPQFIWNLGEPFAVRKIYRPSATEVEPHIYNPDWSQAKITCETKDNTQTHSNYLVNLSPKITVMMIIMPLVIILSLFEVNFPMFETKTILLLKHLYSLYACVFVGKSNLRPQQPEFFGKLQGDLIYLKYLLVKRGDIWFYGCVLKSVTLEIHGFRTRINTFQTFFGCLWIKSKNIQYHMLYCSVVSRKNIIYNHYIYVNINI